MSSRRAGSGAAAHSPAGGPERPGRGLRSPGGRAGGGGAEAAARKAAARWSLWVRVRVRVRVQVQVQGSASQSTAPHPRGAGARRPALKDAPAPSRRLGAWLAVGRAQGPQMIGLRDGGGGPTASRGRERTRCREPLHCARLLLPSAGSQKCRSPARAFASPGCRLVGPLDL